MNHRSGLSRILKFLRREAFVVKPGILVKTAVSMMGISVNLLLILAVMVSLFARPGSQLAVSQPFFFAVMATVTLLLAVFGSSVVAGLFAGSVISRRIATYLMAVSFGLLTLGLSVFVTFAYFAYLTFSNLAVSLGG